MSRRFTTYLERLDELPPAYCRLLARETKRGGWHKILTVTQIAQASGLTWQKVAAIIREKSFARVAVADADKFRKGCGITPQNERRHKEFLKRNFARPKSFDRYFHYSKAKGGRSWRSRFMNRILKRL